MTTLFSLLLRGRGGELLLCPDPGPPPSLLDGPGRWAAPLGRGRRRLHEAGEERLKRESRPRDETSLSNSLVFYFVSFVSLSYGKLLFKSFLGAIVQLLAPMFPNELS